jgi:DNA-binding helix-turn-helix protein|nr:MAG TPA: helix-turn-helix domain protein [Caudoviricetes sp.]
MTIGERIKQRRIELGLSVDEVAEKLGKNRATVYRYESNEIENLPVGTLEPLAKILETTPAQLMGWDDDESQASDERTKRLRKAVENSGYSQTQLCEITGINKGALSSYLSGRYYPKQQAIEKLSEALNVPIFWLMGYDTESDSDSQEEDSYYIDKEARELAQFLYENPKYKILFDAAKDVSAEDLEMVKTIIDKFKK